ncbi:MAG: hypothetical protein JW720_11470 [Sedimentisphaerales bacterium]|nr:hypothetical protein [Sedimentisphaerales bacterium]
MGSFSDYLEDRLLDHVFGKGDYTPGTIYVALSTQDPLDDGSGLAEPAGNGYARVQTTPAKWNPASGGAIGNADAVTFGEATGDWGNVTHFAVMDALSGGNMLAGGALAESRSLGSGDTLEFSPGGLNVTLD